MDVEGTILEFIFVSGVGRERGSRRCNTLGHALLDIILSTVLIYNMQCIRILKPVHSVHTILTMQFFRYPQRMTLLTLFHYFPLHACI